MPVQPPIDMFGATQFPGSAATRFAGALLLAVACVVRCGAAPGSRDAAYTAAVESDWARQEQRWGRSPDSAEALSAARARAEALRSTWRDRLPPADRESMEAEWEALRREAASDGERDDAERRSLYRRVRWFARELLMREPAITGQPLLFLKRNRYVCQMLHEYMGYFYDYGNVAGGGGVFVLERPGASFATRDLLGGSMSGGNFTTLALSADGGDVYFAYAERSARKPDFRSAARKSFHLYRVAPDGTGLRALTDGVEDDFDPCPLPDGGLAFMSTRRGGFARCNNAWEPCASYTLHRMDADGGNIRTLSPHETSEWHPSVLNDGRLVYIRWDYVDRSAANFHGLWTSRPDGTGVASLFGNYTMRINACYQPRAVPGSEKILFVAGAHHADVGGSLVLLDPRRVRYDAATGEDSLESVEVLTPEVCFPESTGWPKSYFHSPWPLSEDAFLVSFSHDPLPGMSSGEGRDTRTGLYYFDRRGNLELLYLDPGISSMYPVPLKARARPTELAPVRDERLGDEGEFLLADVNRSLFPLPAGRPIRELRIFQVLPKDGSHTANDPRIGHANAESARLLLGTVPVETDGSAYFRAPAGKPLYFQAVDGEGRAVQSMRSVTYLQPGERRGCIGCHERPGTAPASRPTLALQREASRIAPGPEGSRPFSFPLLVQPILDRSCVRCHDGRPGDGRGRTVLTGESQGGFSRSYAALKPYLRWYEWGGDSISQIATHPGRVGSDESPLAAILDDAQHGGRMGLAEADRRRLYLWLDANVPFYGTYSREGQLAQREGRSLEPPRFQ